jgi:hypothetical protein
MRKLIIGFAFFIFILLAIIIIDLPTVNKSEAATTCAVENAMCGGFAGTQCCSGLTCQLLNSFPDATGICLSQIMPLTITTVVSKSGLPYAYVNQAYSTNIIAVGGTGPYTWQVSAGSLPPGLTLSSPTCQLKVTPCQPPAVISGTPTTMGTYNFTITVQSGTESVSIPYILQVVDSPWVQILSLFSGNDPVYPDKTGRSIVSSSSLSVSAVAYACCSRSVMNFSSTTLSVNDLIFPTVSHIIETFGIPGPRDPVIGFGGDVILQPGDNVVKAAVADKFNQATSTSVKVFRVAYNITSPQNGTVFDLNSVGNGISQANSIKVVVHTNVPTGNVYVNGVYASMLDPSVGGDGMTWIAAISLTPGVNIITVNAPGYGGPAQDRMSVTFNPTRNSPAPPPLAFSANAISSSQIDLNITGPDYYNSPTDLRVYRNGVQQQPVLIPLMPGKFTFKYSDMGLAANTAYSYYVATYDGSLTYSPLLNKSRTVSAKTWPAMSTKFIIGDNIKVYGTSVLNVRTLPLTSGSLAGSQKNGAKGKVIGGPVWANSYWWWQIDYLTGADGWSVQNYLVKY